jgi:hypothetical protein
LFLNISIIEEEEKMTGQLFLQFVENKVKELEKSRDVHWQYDPEISEFFGQIITSPSFPLANIHDIADENGHEIVVVDPFFDSMEDYLTKWAKEFKKARRESNAIKIVIVNCNKTVSIPDSGYYPPISTVI